MKFIIEGNEKFLEDRIGFNIDFIREQLKDKIGMKNGFTSFSEGFEFIIYKTIKNTIIVKQYSELKK